jgi:hypothetical protein
MQSGKNRDEATAESTKLLSASTCGDAYFVHAQNTVMFKNGLRGRRNATWLQRFQKLAISVYHKLLVGLPPIMLPRSRRSSQSANRHGGRVFAQLVIQGHTS